MIYFLSCSSAKIYLHLLIFTQRKNVIAVFTMKDNIIVMYFCFHCFILLLILYIVLDFKSTALHMLGKSYNTGTINF